MRDREATRKRADQALRESEQRFRQFADASPDIVWVRDVESLQWEYLSPSFERIYGLSCERALAGDNFANWVELIVPEDRETAVSSIRRVCAGEQVTFEYRVKGPVDGQIRWLRNTDFPLRDHSGRIQRIGGFGEDVTTIKAADERLRESERRQRALIEGVPQLVWRAVDTGEWTWSSPQWTAYTGLPAEVSRDRGWLDALHADDRGRAMDAWEKAQSTGAYEVEYRVFHMEEDRHRWFSTRASPVWDEQGQVVEWLGTSTDIDDLRRLQDEQQVMVAELQHRTRNLIGVVRSIAQQTMARTGPTSSFQEQFSDRMEALARVQGLLSRSDQEPITIEALIRMELDALGAFQAAGDRITLQGPPAPIRNSVVQTLALALHELATNARKYGALAEDNGRLSIRWILREADGRGAALAVVLGREGPQPDSRGA